MIESMFLLASDTTGIESSVSLFVGLVDAFVTNGDEGDLLLFEEQQGLYADLWRVKVGKLDELPEAFLE